MTQSINNSLMWKAGFPYKEGDIFTLEGRYKRRSFFQWLKNEPRELKKFKVIGNASLVAGGITRYDTTD